MNIIAIGGGSLEETAPINRELLRLTEKEDPTVLFLPTASGDERGYIVEFHRAFGDLGAKTRCLSLTRGEFDPAAFAEADAIYVGGGNTKAMLELWRELGVDKLLRTHLELGKPAGGLSAGAICWFQMGNSDWPQYENIPNVNTAPLEGLGLVPLTLCPHTLDEGFRLSEFREMMKSIKGPGIGLDDGSAIQIRGADFRILAAVEGRVAHRIEWVDGILTERILTPTQGFVPLAEI